MKQNNNFDLLRVIFAATVVVWHAYDLSKAEALTGIAGWFNADLAVKAFFVVSGYLVVMSCERSRSLADYAGKRLRRIYPAYVAVLLLAVAGGALITALPSADYLSTDIVRYLGWNLMFLNFIHPTLPGVFESNPWQEVNGALWTLKIEVMFYALVPVVVLMKRRLGAATTLMTLILASMSYRIGADWLHESTGRMLWLQLGRQLPGQLTYFLAGTALYWYREAVARHWRKLVIAAVAAWTGMTLVAVPLAQTVLEPLWLSIIVIYLAVGIPYFGNFARFGDFSYGLYILHFPVIQTAVQLGWFDADPWGAFCACLVIVMVLASISWHVIEKPFLGRVSHYRQAEGADVGQTVDRL